jgi:DNA polymerase elongation subunit (family B)
MSEPKVLYFDLETSPMLAAVFSLYKPVISIQQIKEHSRIICWSAMWQGSKRVLFDSEYHSDYITMLTGIRDLLDEADIVVGYNSDSFDIPWVNEQFTEAGLELPSPYNKVDIYKVNKGNLYLASRKLDYMAQRLMGESKVTHSGIKMWMDAIWGNDEEKAKAWRTFKRYAIQDTKLLPGLHKKMLPFIRNVNVALYGDSFIACTHCGSDNIQRRGYRHTNAGVFQRYQCNDCRSYSFDPKRVDTTALRPMGA